MSDKKKAQGQAFEEGQIVDSVLGRGFSHRGWNRSNPGNPDIVRRTFDVEGKLISEDSVNTDEEIQAKLPGTRIYDVIDKVNQGFMPMYQDGAEYLDLTEQPETDGDALRIAKLARAEFAKLQKEQAEKELADKVEKKEETKEMETTLDYKAEYEKLKAMMEAKQ